MKRDRFSIVLIYLIFLFFNVFTKVFADDIHWIGLTDNSWSTPANWSSNAVPGSLDVVYFDSGSVNCNLDIEAHIQSILFASSYTGTFSLSSRKLWISGDADFNLATSLTFTIGDTITFEGNSAQFFTPKSGTLFPVIVQYGVGNTTIQNQLHALSIVIINGRLQNGLMGNIDIDNNIVCNGGELMLGDCNVSVKGDVDFRLLSSLSINNTKMTFNGATQQNYYPKANQNSPAITVMNPTMLFIRGNHCLTSNLSALNGQIDMESSLNADTISIQSPSSLMLNNTVGNSDTVRVIQGNGYLNLRNSELCLTGDTIDMSAMMSIMFGTSGSLSFIGTNQSFIPKYSQMYRKILCRSTGTVTVNTNNLIVDSLSLVSGEFNLGNGLADSIGSFLEMLGGTLNFNYSTLKIGSMFFNFNGPGTIIPDHGTLEFGGMYNHTFVPRIDGVHPKIIINGMTTNVVGNQLRANRVEVNGGMLIMDTSMIVDTLWVNSGSTLQLDTATGNKDTVNELNGYGYVDLRNSELCLTGSNVNLSMFNNISGGLNGAVSLIGNNQTFTASHWSTFRKIIRDGTGTTVVLNNFKIDTLELRSGVFNLGNNLTDTVNGAIKMRGGTLNFNNSTIDIGCMNLDLSGPGTIIPGIGMIRFNRYYNQMFKPSLLINPKIMHMSGYELTIKDNVLRTRSLIVDNGTIRMDSTLNVDTLIINPLGTLNFDLTATYSDTIGNFNGSGTLNFGNKGCVFTRDIDFSNLTSISGSGNLYFGSLGSQNFKPKIDYTYNTIVKAGPGALTINGDHIKTVNLSIHDGALNWNTPGNDTIYDTLSMLYGSMTLGSHAVVASSLLDSSGAISLNNGRIVRSGMSGVVRFGPLSSITSNQGYLEFSGNPNERTEFYPQETVKLPTILKTGYDTVVCKGNLSSKYMTLNNGVWDWGVGNHHSVDSFRCEGGLVRFGSSMVEIISGKAEFVYGNQIDPGTGILSFIASNGIQSLTPSSTQQLPLIKHTGTARLQLYANNLSCRGFEQIGGSLDFNGMNIQSTGNCTFSSTDTLIGLAGRTIQASGNISFNGVNGKLLYCNPPAGWNVSAMGTLTADYAVISNCTAQISQGTASQNSVNAGNNVNWYFITDITAPDNDIVLNAAALDTGTVKLKWKPDVVDSADFSSIKIWIDTINNGTLGNWTNLLCNLSRYDSVYTVGGLKSHKHYYFALSVEDSHGNVANLTSSSVKDVFTMAEAPVLLSSPSTVHQPTFSIQWQNPAGLSTKDTIFIHVDTVSGTNWKLLKKVSSSSIASNITIPSVEGSYRIMLSTSFDSAGIHYVNDAAYSTFIFTIDAPVITTTKDTFTVINPVVTWNAPSGMISTDSIFIYTDTINGVNNWTRYGKYGYTTNSIQLVFNRLGSYKYRVSTSWDSTGFINNNNVSVRNIILIPSSVVVDTILPHIVVPDTTKPLPVNNFRAIAVTCSTTTLTWDKSIDNDIDSFYVCASTLKWPENHTDFQYIKKGKYPDTVSTLTGLPKDGVTLFVRLFLKDYSGNISFVDQKNNATIQLQDCAPPANVITLLNKKYGDTITVYTLTIDTAAKGKNIFFANSNNRNSLTDSFITLPYKDTIIIKKTTTAGTWYACYAMSDSSNNKSQFSFDSVEINNSAPHIYSLSDTLLNEHTTLNRVVRTYDINNDSITVFLLHAPAGMVINGNMLEWTPGNKNVGLDTVIIGCKDVKGAQQLDTFIITVINVPDAPVITLNGPDKVFEDSTYSGVISVADSDMNDVPSIRVVQKPSWMNKSGMTLSGTPTNDNVGAQYLEVIATDKDSLRDTLSVAINVINTNDKPEMVSSNVPDTMIEKKTFSGTVIVRDVDIDDSLNAIVLSQNSWVRILSTSKVTNTNTWNVSFSCEPMQSDTGIKDISIKVSDKRGEYATYSKRNFIVDADDPPQKPAISKRVAMGAVQYTIKSVDDRDKSLFYIVNIVSVNANSIVYKDSSQKTLHVICPLLDGTYILNAHAIDNSGLVSSSVLDTFTINNINQQVWNDTSWTMISVPGKNINTKNLKSSSFLLHWDESGVDQQVFSFYKKKEEIPVIEPGKSYWHKGISADTIMLTKENMVNENVTLKLEKNSTGWNQIASPFPYPVVWPRSGDVIWQWNSLTKDYIESPRIIEPWKGYWIRVDTACEVVLTPQPVFSATGLSKLRKTFFSSGNDWNVQVSLSTGSGSDADNRFGFSPQAKDNYDQQDRPEPPKMSGSTVLYFPHNDWNINCKEFASDIRKVWKETNVFEIAYSGKSETGTGKLVFDGLDITRDIYAFIIEKDSAVCVKNGDSYEIPITEQTAYKTIFVTNNKDFSKNLPLQFKMGNPYPNPFCPLTKIQYTLPYRWDSQGRIISQPYNVSVEIYDIMGRKIQTLIDRKANPGHYTVTWDGKMESGRIVASGNYFCTLRADDLRQVKKLTLVK